MGGGVACQQPTEPEAKKYTISFDSGIESITVEDGAVATEPTTAPEKTGYTFGGWLNGEAAYDWTKPVKSNLSLTAKWTPTEYTITYLPEGVETDNPTTYTIETETIVLDTNPTSPDAAKTEFVAWHVDSEEGAVVAEIPQGSTGNKTFYAEFSAEEPCVVKFMLGTEEVKSINVKKDTKITLPTDLEKYNLFYDSDCTKAFDTNTAITEDTTIYVKLKTFTISYKVLPFDNVNPVEGKTNGSISVEYGTVFTDEKINELAEEIDGYTCKGIFTDEACTVLFDNTKAITSDLTVYVLYEEEPCVVKFMLGTTEVESTEVKKDTKITLPTGFEKYNLFSDADCTTAFDTTTAITEDTTIYVKLKTFTISYKVLPFDNVNPVEGETNGSMPVEYGTVFTEEEINAFAEKIDGYTYKGVFTDEACTVLFDNTNEITSDLTVYVLYEEVVEEDPTKAALATILEFNKEYTGYLEFTYGDVASGEGWQNVSASEIYLNLPKDSLAENGTVKVVYSISGISENATSVTTQGVFDNWGWKDTINSTADGTEIVKTWTITAEGITKMADSDYASFKIVPQYGNADCADFVGTKIKVVVSNLKVTYTPPRTLVADGEPVEIAFDQWGNMAESAFEGYSDDDVLILTYSIDGSVDGVVGWGCGKISSYGDSTKGKDIPVQQLGDNVFKISYADFKDWLPIKHPEYNIGGLNWNMYSQGSATPTRVSAKMQKMKVQE